VPRPSARARRCAPLAVLACAFGAGAAAHAAPPTAAPRADERFLDVRLAERAGAAAANAPAGLAARSPRTEAKVESARADLTGALGRQAVLDVDPLTGSVRQLAKLDGALTSPTGVAPATTARAYARDHATALGLDAADVDALDVAGQERSGDGLTVVHFAQQVDGIPVFDNGLRVALDHAGRVLSVSGAPRSDLPRQPQQPALTAAQALDRLMTETGLRRTDVTVTSTAADARQTTRFSTGDVARLTLFGASTVRLAWHLTYAATSLRWYDAVVDARTGAVLYRANLVKFADVYHNYPGAPVGGTQVSEPLAGYLDPGATTLTGPNVHAWADINDNDDYKLPGDAGEEVSPTASVTQPSNTSATGHCDAQHLCAWNHLVPTSWNTPARRAQNVIQTFWYANHYHDHLAAPPIGFDAASGNFEGDDPLELNALDGANTAGDGGPDAAHTSNANMATMPDGRSPRMQMYLFSSPFRDINGGDDAAVLYHEYTHGLTSRLITTGDGTQALNSPHSGAMGEGWSDWYAQDLLVRENQVVDDPAVDGDVDMGRYVDWTRHSIRYQALDCAVGSTNTGACPAAGAAPAGGFTFGDFGRIAGAPEVHADGEIWAQTLWQLRQRLVADLGETAGSDAAERLITDALRLSVPEPSFLDMRNAILQADTNDNMGANHGLIWDVFASRGMGFYAAVADSSDAAPIEDFNAPPTADTPRGAISGTVTDAASGAPLPGIAASIGGLSTDPAFETYLAGTSDAAGRYAINNVPAGAYGKVVFRSGAGYDAAVRPTTVTGTQTAPLDVQLERDWAAAAGGARVAFTNDDDSADYGCGAAALIDQSPSAGWSAVNQYNNPNPVAVIELPQPVTVTRLGLNPTNTCGDDPSASTAGYRVDTSPDNQIWTTAAAGAFTAADRERLNPVTPTAGTERVKFVRLTLLTPQGETPGTSGADYIDFTELAVYGRPSGNSETSPPGGTTTQPPTTTTPPNATAPKKARPLFVLPRTGSKGRVRVRLSCKDACRLRGTLTVTRSIKQRARLRSLTVARLAPRTIKGTRTVTITLTSDARKRLRRHHLRRLRVALRLTATVSGTGGSRTTAARSITLKI
jgi:extracellular elastinolytic metalloproteinase